MLSKLRSSFIICFFFLCKQFGRSDHNFPDALHSQIFCFCCCFDLNISYVFCVSHHFIHTHNIYFLSSFVGRHSAFIITGDLIDCIAAKYADYYIFTWHYLRRKGLHTVKINRIHNLNKTKKESNIILPCWRCN